MANPSPEHNLNTAPGVMLKPFGHQQVRRRPLSEINVVPYIDVTLVLLVIFMLAAPILQEGIKVQLPQVSAPVLPSNTLPVVVTVDAMGSYYLNIYRESTQAIDSEFLRQQVAQVLREHPETPVLVKADERVGFGMVVNAMVLVQQAGAPSVGLMTKPRPASSVK